MTGLAWLAVGVAAWFLLSTSLAMLVGRILRNRNGQAPTAQRSARDDQW